MTELLLRLRRDDDGTTDLAVVVEPGHTVAELARALAAHVGAAPVDVLTTERPGAAAAEPSDPVTRLGLVSGDTVRLGRRAGRAVGATAVATIDVVGGPEAGRTHDVTAPGCLTLGRGNDADVRFDDPSVSRRHAVIEVAADGSATIRPDPAATNGVSVGAAEIAAATPLAPTDVVGLGGTRLCVRPVERRPARRVDRLGHVDVHRTPYRPPVVKEREVDPIGPIPDRPEPRRLQVLAVLAPLAAGLVMYAVSRQAQFLALTLVAPVVMIGTAIEERRSGRRATRARVADFRAGLTEHRRRLDALRAAERAERFRSAPDLADLVRRAEQVTTDLWPRGRESPDVLSLRLGLGPDRVRFPITLADGGADDLRTEAEQALAGLDRLEEVPVTVDLTVDAVVGIHGDGELVDGAAASLVVQAALLHSPEDLTIAAAVGPDRALGWITWLPHTRSVVSPLSGAHVVRAVDAVDRLVDRLLAVVTFRAEAERIWPRVLVVLDADLCPDPATTARLLHAAATAGIAVLWLASTGAAVPRQATRTLALRPGRGGAMRGRLWSTDPEVDDVDLEIEHLRPDRAAAAARALAPLRDASTASRTTSIPRTAPLLDVLGVGRPTAAWVVEHWQLPSEGLSAPIGMGPDGPLVLDLVEDGPHTLIGGTSGAGKSELLQSMVAAMAVHHPPTRLNFLFVDYKGGASTQVFERLPHTVGYVTNLDVALARRALVSLRAELGRRMRLLEGRAKDLAEMRRVAPDDAPPSLVIVVDEFATLVREVPDFVAGVVDIAQRGRSLGIHLVLATQRPTGSVDENILANTGLRISLRMLDATESNAIVGSPAAADIPVPLRGRGFVRLGPHRLVEFQSAFAGAPLTAEEVRPPVVVTPLDPAGSSAAEPGEVGEVAAAPSHGPTHLDAILDAVAAAADRLRLDPPRRPWREMLPEFVALDELLDAPGAAMAHARPGRFVVVGLLDDPEHQDQRPAVLDLEEGGGCLVFGSGGAGGSTFLRTVAASVTATAPNGEAAVMVFDLGGRGLGHLRDLPVVVDVATGDDLEAVTRHLLVLDAELERRSRLLAALGGEELAVDELPRIVVLVDGLGALTGTLLDGGAGSEEWSERLVRLVVDGRRAGIHWVATADRRSAVPARLQAAIANRIVLRHADDAGYAEHGIPSARVAGLDLPPGRGLLQGSLLVQVATVSTDPAAGAQAATMRSWRGGCRPAVLRSAPLPDHLDIDLPAADAPAGVVLGVADVTGSSVSADLTWSGLTVLGPPRSGRSCALVPIVDQLAGRFDLLAVGPSSCGLREHLAGRDATTAFGRADTLVAALDRLANLLALDPPGADPRVLVVDDADRLDDPALLAVFERLCRCDHLRTVVALEQRSMVGYTANPLVDAARRARRLLVLQPDDPAEFLQVTGVKLAVRPGLRMRPGRGVLLTDRIAQVVQVSAPRAARSACTGADVGTRREAV